MSLASTTIHPYGARLHYATTPESWAILARRFGQPAEAPNTIGRCDRVIDVTSGRMHIIVWANLARHRTAHDVLATIAHESYHAAVGLLDALGDQPTSGEAFAYLTEWITVWLARKTPGLTVTFENDRQGDHE